MSSNKQPWKKRREIPDLQVQDAAEQYDDARQLLQQQPPGSGVLPLLNTAAVAVELFLKSLSSKLIHVPVDGFNGLSIVHAEPELKHHRLVKLFDNISDNLRSQLEADFALYTSGPIGKSLRDVLAMYEGLFASSRYPFEAKTNIRKYPLMPLMELSAFLRAFVAKMKPTDQIEW